MKIIFGRSHTLASIAIRLWTWSTWSHVGVVIGDYVVESTAKKGVVKTPLREFINRYSTIEFAEIQGNGEDALKYLGAKYDWTAIFGIFLRTGWNKPDKLVCSELIGIISQMFRANRGGRVTPEHIYMVSKPIVRR